MTVVTEYDVAIALEKKYSGEEWAFFRQVRNGAGFSASRTCDAIAFNLWPSRGLTIIGFEIKCYRSDWLSELKNPRKSEEVMKNCDHWFLVTSTEEVARLEEIPATWGWMVKSPRVLSIKKQAPQLNFTKNPSKSFYAAVMKNAKMWTDPDELIQKKIEAAEKKAAAETERRLNTDIGALTKERDRLLQERKEFEEKSGLQIDSWNIGQIGEAVRSLMRADTRARSIEYLITRESQTQRELVDLKKEIASIKALSLSIGKDANAL